MTVPTNAQFFSREDPTKPDVAFLKNHFYREGRITEEQALYIIQKGTELLRAEPNLLEVDAPITGECKDFSLEQRSLTATRYRESLWRHSWAVCKCNLTVFTYVYSYPV